MELDDENDGEEKELLMIEALEEVEEGADEGEMLVIRRALSGITSQQDIEQRENIFHTRCTVKGKVCSLIIDGRSCVSVASKTLVEKLKLSVSPHPEPYTIQWLNQDKGLRISSHYLLSFSICKNYRDELWYDIVPMDACHVLLGRPWLFDRSVMHDGRLNTYTFTKEHKKITLTPLKPHPQKRPQDTPGMDAFLTTLLHSQLHECDDFKEWILLGQEPTEAKDSSHPLLSPLLKVFEHVFPSEVPHGLRPKRSIQHKIGLIPNATLPIKPAYRMNPQET